MGKRAKGTTVLTAQVFEDRKSYVKSRAETCGKTVSQYAAAIVDEWLRRGGESRQPPMAALWRASFVPVDNRLA